MALAREKNHEKCGQEGWKETDFCGQKGELFCQWKKWSNGELEIYDRIPTVAGIFCLKKPHSLPTRSQNPIIASGKYRRSPNSSMMKSLFTISTALFLLFGKTLAQAPQVATVFPAGLIISAALNTPIAVTFDAPIDLASVSTASFRVFGRWSGPATGSFSFLDNNNKVQFQPDEPFFAGEGVLVQLSKSIKSASGASLEKPYAWGFWTYTAPGELDQELVETIELRLPGETYLQTYGAYAGDMNNDGYSDLVAVNESSDDLRILLNDGQGNYPDFTVFDTGNESTPSPSEGADFNNDGKIDLVVTTAWDTEVRILTGDGLGGFTNMDTYFTSNGVRGVVVGDFDGDGWDDMLTTNRLAGDISIFMNDGDGTFTESNMNLPGGDETACALTDANGDGLLDVYFAMFNAKKMGVLLGDGAGNFTLSGNLVSVQGKPWMIGSGDFNGDGFPDVSSANSDCNCTVVLFGDGQGGLSQPVTYTPPQHNFPLAMDIGDIDGDGDLDFITSNYSSKTYTVFENDGTGQFTAPVTLQAPAASSCAILHDRDNDNDLDITATDEEADVILLFENYDSTIINSVSNPFRVATDESWVFPNPASDEICFTDAMPAVEDCELILYNVLGRQVGHLQRKSGGSGNKFACVTVSGNLEAGAYFLLIQSPTFKRFEKICLLK